MAKLKKPAHNTRDLEFTRLLRLGRFWIEGDDVGSLSVTRKGDQLELRVKITSAKNPAAVWIELTKKQKKLSAVLETLGLDKTWFTHPTPPRGQNRTPWYMACELVAARVGSTTGMISKLAGGERKKREKMRAPSSTRASFVSAFRGVEQ